MNAVKEGITVISNVLTPSDHTLVLANLDINWAVMDDHAMVSKAILAFYTMISAM